MAMDLKVTEQVQRLTWNFEPVKAELISHIEKYANLVVNETNLYEMEKSQKEIASLRIKLQKFRLAVKKELEKPFDVFDLQIKELTALVESAELPIKNQLQKYEDERRENKRIEVQKMIESISSELGLGSVYARQIVIADNYLNRTQRVNDTRNDIQQKVCWFLDIQNKDIAAEAARNEKISMAKLMVELLSNGLATPLTFQDVETRLESLNITELRVYIENQVTIRREREERAAQQAIEREEQKRIAEVVRQEKVVEAYENQMIHNVAMEKLAKEQQANVQIGQAEKMGMQAESKDEATKPVQKLDIQIIMRGTNMDEYDAVAEFLTTSNIIFKSDIREVK